MYMCKKNHGKSVFPVIFSCSSAQCSLCPPPQRGPHEIIVRPKGDKNFVSEWGERRHWALSTRQASSVRLNCRTLNLTSFERSRCVRRSGNNRSSPQGEIRIVVELCCLSCCLLLFMLLLICSLFVHYPECHSGLLASRHLVQCSAIFRRVLTCRSYTLAIPLVQGFCSVIRAPAKLVALWEERRHWALQR